MTKEELVTKIKELLKADSEISKGHSVKFVVHSLVESFTYPFWFEESSPLFLYAQFHRVVDRSHKGDYPVSCGWFPRLFERA